MVFFTLLSESGEVRCGIRVVNRNFPIESALFSPFCLSFSTET
jgi:hypothetical protein